MTETSDPSPAGPFPSVSVIVPTFNSARELASCLDSIRSQRYDGAVELLVVDGGSTDGTLELARRHGARVVPNPAVTELGFGGGKDLGLREATGELVAMVDADNVLIEPTYLASMVAPFASDSSVVVSIPAPFIPPRGDAPSICRYFCLRELDYWYGLAREGTEYPGWRTFRPERIVFPNGGLVPARRLRELGGWDFDTEVGARLFDPPQSRAALVHAAHRFHREVLSLADVYRKLDRRFRTQMERAAEKPVVEAELRRWRADPLTFLRRELGEPLRRAWAGTDPAYLQVVPTLATETALFLARGAWRGSRPPS